MIQVFRIFADVLVGLAIFILIQVFLKTILIHYVTTQLIRLYLLKDANIISGGQFKAFYKELKDFNNLRRVQAVAHELDDLEGASKT